MSGLLRASVLVGSIETSYRRAGVGRPLVLLVPPPRDAASLAPLLARWRVIIPESTSVLALPDSPGAPAFARWLHGFLEGLGVSGVLVAAGAGMAEPIKAVQTYWPELIAHLELLGAAPHDWRALAQTLDAVVAD